MRLITITSLLAALVVVPASWAQDEVEVEEDQVNITEEEPGMTEDYDLSDEQAGTAEDTALTTEATEREVTRGYLEDELIGIKPQVGTVVFTDPNGDTASRLAGGLQLDMNAMKVINKDLRKIYIGPSVGVIYSHLGASGSNFVGTSPDGAATTGSPGANLLIIPADLKLGYTFGRNFRVSAHGGGNVIYRSVASSMLVGSSSAQTGDDWRVFPNVGGDLEFGLGRNVAVLIRPDVTITPGDEIFTGTVGLAIPIG